MIKTWWPVYVRTLDERNNNKNIDNIDNTIDNIPPQGEFWICEEQSSGVV